MTQTFQFSLAIAAAATVMHSVTLAQTSLPRRSPTPAYWSNGSGNSGAYSTPQAVCDEWERLHNTTQEYIYESLNDHSGKCVVSKPSGVSTAGLAYYGQECPRYYSAKNFVSSCCRGVYFGNFLVNGPNLYCESTIPTVDRWHDKGGGQCQPKGGNPIFPLTGTKQQSENLLVGSPRLTSLSITFDNRRKLPNTDPDGAFVASPAPSFGGLWESSLHKRLVIQQGGPPGNYRNIQASRGAGVWISFIRTVTNPTPAADSDVSDRLVVLTSGWRYIDAAARAQENYDSAGLLTLVAPAHGGRLTYAYSTAPIAGLLIKVEDQFGRAVRFEYEQPSGVPAPRIARVVDPDEHAIQAGYDDSGNLSQLTWPDGYVRKYLYDQSALPWALTGILDENNERHSTYSYDDEGRARSTEYAGGVNRFSIGFSSPPGWVTTETLDSANGMLVRDHRWVAPQDAVMATPNGAAIAFGATLVNGMPRVTTRSQPAGAGCDASSSSLTYDANGNVASKTDFNGTKNCHAHDLSRNLETARLEGLAGANACPADIAAQEITSDTVQRKTMTQWHPDWSLPIKRAEPGKLTTNVYNGQPDPTAGNAVAACAPTTALLPDGKRIVVLCKKVEQTTTDATGALGFNATPTGTHRTWTYTYNEHGQVLTARDPLNNLTTYTYYPETTADYTKGDIKSVTNPAGHATQYTRYDRSGHLLESVDANGTKTETAYTPRGWVKTVTTTPPGASAQATVYDYDGVGQLKKATLSDGTALEYAYDAAHRLRSIKDAAGNAVTYTLDNMGNRTGEELKDASGTLARNISRVYDALNRVQSATGAAQ